MGSQPEETMVGSGQQKQRVDGCVVVRSLAAMILPNKQSLSGIKKEPILQSPRTLSR